MISLTAHSPPQIRESKHPRVPSRQSTQAIKELRSLSLLERQGAPPTIRLLPSSRYGSRRWSQLTPDLSRSLRVPWEISELDSTLPPLDERAQDKNEDGDDERIPPPLFKRNPEDKDAGTRPSFSDPATLAKISAIKEAKKKQKEARAAQEISPAAHSGGIVSCVRYYYYNLLRSTYILLPR